MFANPTCCQALVVSAALLGEGCKPNGCTGRNIRLTGSHTIEAGKAQQAVIHSVKFQHAQAFEERGKGTGFKSNAQGLPRGARTQNKLHRRLNVAANRARPTLRLDGSERRRSRCRWRPAPTATATCCPLLPFEVVRIIAEDVLHLETLHEGSGMHLCLGNGLAEAVGAPQVQ